jgi:hypothetical protein
VKKLVALTSVLALGGSVGLAALSAGSEVNLVVSLGRRPA